MKADIEKIITNVKGNIKTTICNNLKDMFIKEIRISIFFIKTVKLNKIKGKINVLEIIINNVSIKRNYNNINVNLNKKPR
jgi:hypothetical protein